MEKERINKTNLSGKIPVSGKKSPSSATKREKINNELKYMTYDKGKEFLSPTTSPLRLQKKDEKVKEDQPGLTESDFKYGEIKGNIFVNAYEDKSPVAPNDIIQGLVGDCYFMSSLAAIAKTDPQFIYDMIKDNKDGTWTVRFYLPKTSIFDEIFGEKKIEVKVDNVFPMDKSGMPVYANYKYRGDKYKEGENLKAELWPMIIEKAWAKIKGSYKNIHGGNPGKAMEVITGEESKQYIVKKLNPEKIIKIIESALLKGNPVTAGVPLGVNDDTIPLIENHAYAVLEVSGNKIHLYNPHGEKHPRPLAAEEFKKHFQWFWINKK